MIRWIALVQSICKGRLSLSEWRELSYSRPAHRRYHFGTGAARRGPLLAAPAIPDARTRTDLTYGGPCFIAGYCPTGPDTIYAYLVEKAQERKHEDGPRIMAELAAAYGGPWNEIRANLDHSARINYTWFTTHLVDGPWNRGRTVIIGDAAHSCPPTVAQGAAMALEDASVLAELLIRADDVTETLFKEFTDRRLDRAKAVVNASVQLGQWMLDGVRDADVPGLMRGLSVMLKEPA